MLVYFLIRGMVVDRAGEAIVRGVNIIEIEKDLSIYWELEFQSWILHSYFLIKMFNWIYFWGHLPLVGIIAVWLYVWHRPTYSIVRNAFLASGAIGVVIYFLFPVAPPRLIPFTGFVDTMAVFDRVGYQAQELKPFVNPFAAVPSLHFGWSLLLGGVMVCVTKNWFLRALGILWPVAMFFAVTMTGNHFILDAVAGTLVSFAGLAIAILIARHGEAWLRWATGLMVPRVRERGVPSSA
jgi:hypothetical protein